VVEPVALKGVIDPRACDPLILMFGLQRKPIAPPVLLACAWCERVDLDGHWHEQHAAIERLRTYEWERPPRFTSSICDACIGTLSRKREWKEPTQ